jgi:hypothetical protein
MGIFLNTEINGNLKSELTNSGCLWGFEEGRKKEGGKSRLMILLYTLNYC